MTVTPRTVRPHLILGLVLLAGVTPASAAPLRLTLEEAIARALEKNDDILVERSVRDAAVAANEGAAGVYDPRLDVAAGARRTVAPVNSAFSGAPAGEPAPTDELLDAGATLSRLLPSGGSVTVRTFTSRSETDGAFGLLSPAHAAQLGVELRQPLWRDREVDPARLGLRVTAADRRLAEASLERQVRDTVAAVENAYWRLVAVHRALEVGEETVRLAEEQLEQTQSRIDAGAAPETEIAQPLAELERRRGELLAARESAARAETALKFLVLGDDEPELWARPLTAVDEVRFEPHGVDVGAAMESALAARVELEAARSLIERRQAEADFADDRIRPTLDLVVSYDRFGLTGSRNPAAGSIPGLEGEIPPQFDGGWGSVFGSVVDGDFDEARVALELSLPLGRRTARAEAEIARAAQHRAATDLSRIRKAIRAEVLDAAAALDTARGRIEATRAAREAAEVQLASERDRYEAGLSTNFLVLTRQNDLAGARLSEIEALTDYRTARAELARATGSLLTERGIDLAQR